MSEVAELEVVEETKVEEENTSDQLLEEIKVAEMKVTEAEIEWELARESAKEKKATFDLKVAQLRTLIRKKNEPLPLLDAAENKDGDWRAIPIDRLQEYGVTESITKSLVEARLETLGAFADFMAKDFQKIPNVGPAKRTQIEDAFTKFWEAHPEYCTPAEQPSPTIKMEF